MHNIWVISSLEFHRIRRTWLFWIGLIIIVGVAILIDSPLGDRHMWIPSSAAFEFAHAMSMLGAMFVPILIASLYHVDQTTKISVMLFSQPITPRQYAAGKFVGGFRVFLTIVGIGAVIYILMPLFFGEIPYSPLIFLKALVIYTLPSMFFFTSLCNLLAVFFDRPLLTILVGVLGFILSDHLSPVYDFMIRDKELYVMANGMALPHDSVVWITMNRFAFVGLGILLLVVAIILFSPQKYIESR